MAVPLQLFPLNGLPMIKPGDDLPGLLLRVLTENNLRLEDGDILVLAQKIVSKAEGRIYKLSEIEPSAEAKKIAEATDKDPGFVELVLRESAEVLRTRPGTLIVRHKLGFVCANAGIDHSNVSGPEGTGDDYVLLLPVDPDGSANSIKERIEKETGKIIGVLIIDSHGRAWRLGTVGTTIGIAGFHALVDLRGWEDIYGYKLRITQVAAADELAGAASLIMGQAAERIPAVLARGYPYPLSSGTVQELIRPKDMDLFR